MIYEGSDTSPVLEINDLAVAYKVRGGEVEALQNISLEIQKGETCGIVGESGCGKSTMAWSIVNFLGANGYIKRGSLKLLGKQLVNQTKKELNKLRGNQVSMVFQDPMQSLNPSMRLGEQMKEVLTTHFKISNDQAHKRCIEMLNKVYMPDPATVMKRYPHQISGGQQQRVVIAMALLNNPALLIMDEPTTALDVTVEAAVLDLVAKLREEFDTAIMFITHNLGVVARTCSKVGVMYAGEMVEFASVTDIFDNPQHPYTQGLIRCLPKIGNDKASSTLYPISGRVPAPNNRPEGCVFWPRCDYAQQRCKLERPIVRLIPGTNIQARCHFSEELKHKKRQSLQNIGSEKVLFQSDTTKDPILNISKLKKYYPMRSNSVWEMFGLGKKRYVKALENASFEVHRGKTLGIVGESGCGKSTLLKTIIGLEKASDGNAQFLGFDISKQISRRDVSLVKELQMVFQNPDSTMNPSYSVGSQIARPMKRFRTVPKEQIPSEVIKLLKAMRLSPQYYDRFPRQLSGGEKQRVGIARALASNPDLILCDEPVSALDVSVQAAILNLLTNIQNEFETTLIFISHDLSVVRFISDEVCVMYLGQIMEIGPVHAIYAPPYHPYTEALLSAIPLPDPHLQQKHIRLHGSVPSAISPPQGCRFNTRCPRRNLLKDPAICETAPPQQVSIDGHIINCHISLEQLKKIEPVINLKKVASNVV